MSLRDKPIWAGVIPLGTISLGIVASTRGEPVNAAWLVVAAVCIYFIAHRFYALYITRCAFRVDATRLTPALRRNDGLDYVPTHRVVLFAGAGPLVGPVLAAQMGICPARCGYWPASCSPEQYRT